MEALLIFILIILFILILSYQIKALNRIDSLEEEIVRMRKTLEAKPSKAPATASGETTSSPRQWSRTPGPSQSPVGAEPFRPSEETEPFRSPEETEPFQSPAPSGQPVWKRTPPAPITLPAQTATTESGTATSGPAAKNPAAQPAASAATSNTTSSSSGAGIHNPPPPPAPEPGFFERHPDLEKFIGENLISKIGIAILVLAIGFFVKYAIDNDWIGPAGRVAIGIICGGILVSLAHFLRNNYKAFSSVLVGGGLAIFYFTIALAYHQYHLFGQVASFIIMLVITAFAVLLSLLYDRQELAIIALVGGFVTPFLVSNGNGNYKVLFSYLLILNTGLLIIAYQRAWRLLNLLAFLFTALLFSSWLITLPYDTGTATYRGGGLFATIFYLLFFLINIAHNIKENRQFIASDFGILLANTCLYFAAGLYLLTQMELLAWKGAFSASMGVFNLSASYLLFRKKRIDTNILYLLIGITLTFISITAPLQLHGHYITLFWASESVALFWLYLKSRIRIVWLACIAIWVAMLASMLMDWARIYELQQNALPIIFNKGFVTGLYTALCCFALYRLTGLSAATAPESQSEIPGSRRLPLITGCTLLFFSGFLEIRHQFSFYYPNSELYILYALLFGLTFVFLITWLAVKLNWTQFHGYLAGLLAACILVYLRYIPSSFDIQRDMLESHRYGGHFMAHWAAALVASAIVYRLIHWQRSGRIILPPSAFTWIAGIFIIIFLSAEIQLIVNELFFSKTHPLDQVQTIYFKTGLPILWGLCSFAYMWLGMRYKFKPLRILSLVLFSVTLLKLFTYDIREIPVAGKIAAFFCLGVLLLVVSFMYQRLKKIIIEDEENTAH